MITCVDRDKKIIVFRAITDETGAPARQRMGAVLKKDFELEPELDALTSEEHAELAAMLATYKEAALLKSRAAALTFPETVPDIVRYYEERASDDERKLIATALSEGLRAVRRLNREATSAEIEPW